MAGVVVVLECLFLSQFIWQRGWEGTEKIVWVLCGVWDLGFVLVYVILEQRRYRSFGLMNG